MAHTLSVCPQCDSLVRVDAAKAREHASHCGKCGAKLPLHGLVSEVSAKGLERILAKAPGPVVVDFWASWCGPCRAYAPTFERASLKHADAVFLKIDTERDPELSQRLGIRGIPTTVVFKNGREVRRESGALPEEMIASLLGR